MLDHDERVAEVAHPMKGPDEPFVVALMQPDGGLVQDVEHAHQLRADLGGQPDALGFAAGERRRGAVQGQVVQPHVHHEPQSVLDLLDDPPCDGALPLRQPIGQPLQEDPHLRDGHLRDLRDVEVAERDGQAFRLEPLSSTGGAIVRRHVALDLATDVVAGGLSEAPLQVGDHSFVGGVVVANLAGPVPVAEGDDVAARAVEEEIPVPLPQLSYGYVGPESIMLGRRCQELGVV